MSISIVFRSKNSVVEMLIIRSNIDSRRVKEVKHAGHFTFIVFKTMEYRFICMTQRAEEEILCVCVLSGILCVH